MIRRCRPLLGTYVEIALPHAKPEAFERGFEAVEAVQEAMSFFNDRSDIARLRRARANEIVRVSAMTVEVLRFAKVLFDATDGIFDVTIARKLVSAGRLPITAEGDISDCAGSFDDLEIVDDRHIRSRRATLIDLGGIAKGYAVDCAVEALAREGIEAAIVNAGGDLRVWGGQPQPVTLRDHNGHPANTIMLADGAIATSLHQPGKSRCFNNISQQWIDYATAITVLASTCMEADAMTKVAMADLLLAQRLLEPHGGAVIVPEPRRAVA